MDVRIFRKIVFLLFLGLLTAAVPLAAQEKIVREGEQSGLIVNEGKEVLKVTPIKPGQTLQVFLTPRWGEQNYGALAWRLENPERRGLQAGIQNSPEAGPILMEWTSNSQPKPEAYFIHILGMQGTSAGEVLGQYGLRIFLWDQNDGNAGTDAPETFEKALLLPISEPGPYSFNEGFISSTEDVYDLYKILLKPNHSLTLRANPIEWKGAGKNGKIRFELLNKSFKRLKEGQCLFSRAAPFQAKVFHPRIKGEPRPALFYLLVKAEGEVSAVYSLQAEVKEGR